MADIEDEDAFLYGDDGSVCINIFGLAAFPQQLIESCFLGAFTQSGPLLKYLLWPAVGNASDSLNPTSADVFPAKDATYVT
jgi:hypothetical protein